MLAALSCSCSFLVFCVRPLHLARQVAPGGDGPATGYFETQDVSKKIKSLSRIGRPYQHKIGLSVQTRLQCFSWPRLLRPWAETWTLPPDHLVLALCGLQSKWLKAIQYKSRNLLLIIGRYWNPDWLGIKLIHRYHTAQHRLAASVTRNWHRTIINFDKSWGVLEWLPSPAATLAPKKCLGQWTVKW